ncbi:GDSL-type esterase/lipase family protein [Spirosoma sp.]|uniref:GDSL-type esterase/lipase family protein n=1 Tax=Spirosoma sp. TaxID=1899569 RepID=UPI003B3B38B6
MKYFWIISLLFVSVWANGQTKPAFEDEILAFEKLDKVALMAPNPIVFTGSSSIRLWENLGESFPKKNVVNRGFGGSQLTDVLRYADRVIVRYQPKQVVLYAGENDVASGVSGQQTYERFVALFEHVRQKLPNVAFAFISLKPSPSRRKYFAQMDVANQLIKEYLRKQRNTEFIDIRPVMLTPSGQPVPELFKSDSLHMLPEGYKRWTSVVRRYLK